MEKMAILERKVESYLDKRWKDATGGRCIKFPPLFYAGFPDRICMSSPAQIIFVETKAPDGKPPRPLQLKVHAQLREWGFRVEVLSSKEQVDDFINGLLL